MANFRDPKEVARSLVRRGDCKYARGLKIANVYNERLLKFMTEWLEEMTVEPHQP